MKITVEESCHVPGIRLCCNLKKVHPDLEILELLESLEIFATNYILPESIIGESARLISNLFVIFDKLKLNDSEVVVRR